jgi:hypothetical protein
MRNLQLVNPRATQSGTAFSIVLLDAKFHPNNVVGITVQEKDANGQEIGAVQNFKDTASNPASLYQSANALAVREYGAVIDSNTEPNS